MGPEKAGEYAYKSLPHLVRRANQRRTIYYGELGEKVVLSARSFGDPLDYVRDEVCVPRHLPHLSIIVVLKNKDEMPPDEVIKKSGMRPGETHKLAFDRLKSEVFNYDGWDKLLTDLRLAAPD